MFDFDLQLFGGGGGGGKSTGKLIGAIAFGIITGGTGMFAHAFAGFNSIAFGANFLMGASLFSSIWSAVSRPSQKNFNNDSTANVQRFDRAQETMSSDGQLPVVYGCRKITGNQTWHETNADASILHKHVVLCEGGIYRIEGLSANDLIIPPSSQINANCVVFTIQNVRYADASFCISDRHIYLNCAGGNRSFYLCIPDDMQNDTTYWDYQCSISSLVSYINSLNLGWQVFPVASTNAYPGRLHNVGWVNCYNRPISVTTDSVRGGSSYAFYDRVTPSNYATVGAYTDMAWLDMTFTTASEFSGNPSVSCTVYGLKVYDIRTGAYGYSTNPAMCLRDLMLSKRYGMGKWFTADMLDHDSWVESANYCDQVITFYNADGGATSAKRYELNIVIDSQRSALEWIQEILANFAGYLVYSQGKIKLKIEKPTPVSYKFNDDNMSDLHINPLKLSDTPNRYKVTFVDPLNNWKTITALCEDFADQKKRQRIVTKEVSLEGVTSQNQALRLARFYRDYNLTCPMQVSFKTGQQAMHLEPGDVVTISYHGVFADMPIRIAEIKETNKGTFEISGRQYNDTIYGDELGGGIHFYNYSTMQTPLVGTVPNPTNISMEEDGYIDGGGKYVGHVEVSWKPPNYEFIDSYDVYVSYDNQKTWNNVGVAKDTKYTIYNTPRNVDMYVKIQTVNTVGRKSTGAISYTRLIGKNSPPGDITHFRVGQYSDEELFALDGKLPDDPDVDMVEIRIDGDDWDTATPIAQFKAFPHTLRNVSLSWEGTHVFRAKAVDNVGNYSLHDAVYSLYVRDASRYKNIILEKDDIETGEYRSAGLFKLPDRFLINKWNITFDDWYDATFDNYIDVFDNEMGVLSTWWMSFDTIWEHTFDDLYDTAFDSANIKPFILSDVIDTGHIRVTNINYIFEEEVDDFAITFDDIWDDTFESLWPKDFFKTLSSFEREIYVRFSEDNVVWSDWMEYLSASYKFRYIQYKVIYKLKSVNVRLKIKKLYQVYDVPDIEINYNGKTVNGVEHITFDEEFCEVPEQVSVIVTGSLVAYPIVDVDTKGITVKTFDSNGNKIDTTYKLFLKGW